MSLKDSISTNQIQVDNLINDLKNFDEENEIQNEIPIFINKINEIKDLIDRIKTVTNDTETCKLISYEKKVFIIQQLKLLAIEYESTIDDLFSFYEENEIDEKERMTFDKMHFDWNEKVCDVLTGKKLSDFLKLVKAIKNEPKTRKLQRFKYLDLTETTSLLIKQLKHRDTQWGVAVVTENNTSFCVFRNNNKKQMMLFLIKRFGDTQTVYFKTNEYDNFVHPKKEVTMDKISIETKERDGMEYREFLLTFNEKQNVNQNQNEVNNSVEELKQFKMKFEIYAENDYNYYGKTYYVSFEGNVKDVFEGDISNDVFLFNQENGIYTNNKILLPFLTGEIQDHIDLSSIFKTFSLFLDPQIHPKLAITFFSTRVCHK